MGMGSLHPTLPLLHHSNSSYPSLPSHSIKPLKTKTPEALKKPSSIPSTELVLLLQSCIETKSYQQGKSIHSQILKLGFERNRDLLPKLIKLYSVCGRISIARNLFDRIPNRNLNVFVWTSLISGYIENGLLGNVIGIFLEMLELGVKPDGFTFSSLLKACSNLGFPPLVTQLHSMIVKCGCGSFLSVENSLIHLYGSLCVDVESAHRVFDRMSCRDVVSWTSIIRACCSLEKYGESMELFSRMQFDEDIKPNELTVVSVLPACGFFSSLRRGQAFHAYIIRNGFSMNVIVGASLVSMYSHCGHPDDAFLVFDSLKERNIVLWTSMIEGYSVNGRFDSALELFHVMQDNGIEPNYVTLIVILSACSHGGLIDDGWEIFNSLRDKFGIEPRAEHYACVVDMLGRAGQLDEAEKFINTMSLKPNGSIFGSLLGACGVYGNVDLGERLASRLFELEPNNAANYVMLSNIYAAVERWDDVGRMRQLMAVKGLSKDPGCSWIETKNKVYVFGAHDRSHPESDNIYRMLEDLSDRIIKAGYVPSTKFVLRDVEDDDKKKLLCSHSERLAIAFGLMKTPSGVPIRIAKNIRVCGDCHDAIKLISKVTSRELIIRDTIRPLLSKELSSRDLMFEDSSIMKSRISTLGNIVQHLMGGYISIRKQHGHP
ncbi:hypothetical protein MRB53_027888 [Persea americana]|uniref:Uncharacterized protein n=1 Tax=Persea americana TaxID=3435 RepID=A0ACC2KDY8_PERAE|nr:hypothetical protein MRB53_027888 [Persea americana]